MGESWGGFPAPKREVVAYEKNRGEQRIPVCRSPTAHRENRLMGRPRASRDLRADVGRQTRSLSLAGQWGRSGEGVGESPGR